MSTDNDDLLVATLAEYAVADELVTKAKQALEEANKVRSEVVGRLYNKFGRGPYDYKGKRLGKIVIRGNTYFFRGKDDEGTIKVD